MSGLTFNLALNGTMTQATVLTCVGNQMYSDYSTGTIIYTGMLIMGASQQTRKWYKLGLVGVVLEVIH